MAFSNTMRRKSKSRGHAMGYKAMHHVVTHGNTKLRISFNQLRLFEGGTVGRWTVREALNRLISEDLFYVNPNTTFEGSVSPLCQIGVENER